MTKTIQFVYTKDTKVVSLSGEGCGLDCGHCNKHFLKQMDDLRDPVPDNVKSYLISGGLKPGGKSYILDRKRELAELKAKGYNFNSHVGFVDEEDLNEVAALIDYVSFDFVSDAQVIKRVYKLDKSVAEYIEQYKLLSKKMKVYPHVTIGLDKGKIHWEYEAIDILAGLDADRLVLNIFIPTPGTEFADAPLPDPDEVRKVFKHARKAFKDKPLIVGCMRPFGRYRMDVDLIAIEEGVDRIVQPTPSARKLAGEMGLNIEYMYECCALDQPSYESQTVSQARPGLPVLN